MRILMVFPALGRNGDPLYWGEIFMMLSRIGFDITVLSYERVEFRRYCSRVFSATVKKALRLNSIDLPNPFDVLRKIHQASPDIVFVNEFSPLTFLVLFYRLTRIIKSRTILMVEGHPRHLSGYGTIRDSCGFNLIRSAYCLLADRVLTNNTETENYLKSINCAAHKIIVGPYLTSTVERTSAKKRSSIGNINIAVVAQLARRKGLLQMIDEIALAPSRYRNRIRVDIFGDGYQRDELETLIAKKGLSCVVYLKGDIPREQLLSELNAYNLFVIPTLADYRSLVAFEALSSGLPLLISKYDGSKNEVLIDGENGFSFDPLEKGSLFSKLNIYLNNPRLINKHSEASLIISGRFTLENSLAAFKEAIEI